MMDPELRDCVDEERRLAAVNESLRKQRNEARAQRDALAEAAQKVMEMDAKWPEGTVTPDEMDAAFDALGTTLAAVKGDK